VVRDVVRGAGAAVSGMRPSCRARARQWERVLAALTRGS
jgi:hypothetical protein